MSDTITESVTVSFKVKESTGETVAILDSLSDMAIGGAYDALRIRALAGENEDTETIGHTTDIIKAAKPRAIEAAKALVREAATRQAESLRHGGNVKTRAETRAALKAALRAYRINRA